MKSILRIGLGVRYEENKVLKNMKALKKILRIWE